MAYALPSRRACGQYAGGRRVEQELWLICELAILRQSLIV